MPIHARMPALVATIGLATATGAGAATISAAHDPVGTTMIVMRLAGTLLEERLRETGGYPSPDGVLRPLREVLPAERLPGGRIALFEDAWGRSLLYRASACCFLLVSVGADGRPEQDYRTLPLFRSDRAEIAEAADADSDLVMVNGRFVRRPFGTARAAIETINAMSEISTAMMSYAIDNNRYPGSSATFAPVSGLAADLAPYLPELPNRDGWGRAILYFSTGASFGLASFGFDGEPDRTYYTDLAGGIPWNDEGASASAGADIVFANGHFVNWPTGAEP